MLTNKTISALAALALCQTAFASDAVKQCYRPGEPINCELPPGIIYPAEYEIDPDLYVSAEFIYWKSGKQGTNFIAYNVNHVGTETDNTILYHQQKYKPGFRIDVGMGLPCWDHWVTNVAYTWYQSNTSTSYNAKTNDTITAPGGTTLPTFTANSVSSEFKYHLNFLEGSVGRPMYINERMILNAYFGLKGMWYTQDQTVSYSITNAVAGSPNNAVEKAKIWGVGPYGGLDAKGLLCWNLYLVGKFEMMAPYTRFSHSSLTQNFAYGSTVVNSVASRKNYYGAWPWIDGTLGLGWGDYFGCNRGYHVDIVAAWEFVAAYAAALPGNTFTPREPYMEGFTLRGQLNF
jgi:hypothetical protein